MIGSKTTSDHRPQQRVVQLKPRVFVARMQWLRLGKHRFDRHRMIGVDMAVGSRLPGQPNGFSKKCQIDKPVVNFYLLAEKIGELPVQEIDLDEPNRVIEQAPFSFVLALNV